MDTAHEYDVVQHITLMGQRVSVAPRQNTVIFSCFCAQCTCTDNYTTLKVAL